MSTFIHSLVQQLITPLLMVVCFYLTLTYFHHLKTGDDKDIKKTKWWAVLCLAFAFIVPVLYNMITFTIMMR
ncbi:hypothetical protein [Lysinibacillus cavernae]|uniref:hypothetical protein n=1 Tax=Lysinibacillus cavernae TaxID=2666135 RepID=UPI0012D8A2E2|nr:hypothetical protein [Lysinibacillus cavernae]